MGGTLWRRHGALHMSAIVCTVLNVSMLESVRPVDRNVETGAAAKAQQQSSVVEVGTRHFALANMSQSALLHSEDRNEAGWGRRRKDAVSKDDKKPDETPGDGPERPDTPPDPDTDFEAESDNASGEEVNGVKGTEGNQAKDWQNVDVPNLNERDTDEALHQVDGSAEEVPLAHATVLKRHGGLGDETFSTIDGNLGSRELDLLGEQSDAPSDYNPKLAPLTDQGVHVEGGDPFYVNERETELTHMDASLDTVHNNTEDEGLNQHHAGDTGGFGDGEIAQHGPGAAVSRSHFRETLALEPRVKSAIDIYRSNLGKIRVSASNVKTMLENSLIPLHQINQRVDDVDTHMDSLKSGLQADRTKAASLVANPLDGFAEKGVYGSSNGKDFASNAGQWGVFSKMLACHKKCLPESLEVCLRDCLGTGNDYLLEDELGIEHFNNDPQTPTESDE